jgi:hypothetical protein
MNSGFVRMLRWHWRVVVLGFVGVAASLAFGPGLVHIDPAVRRQRAPSTPRTLRAAIRSPHRTGATRSRRLLTGSRNRRTMPASHRL